MAKKEYERGRNDGFMLAWRLLHEAGQDTTVLDKEREMRGWSGINTSLTTKELDAVTTPIKEMTLDTVLVLSIAALHDEFGFGEKRCIRFMDKFMEGSEYLIKGYATWKDYVEEIKSQLGFEVRIRWND